MRIYMQTTSTPDQPLRFYHLQLQPDLLGGWSLIRESGVQGSRGQSRKAYYKHRSEAERALMKLRDTQLRRGYRVVFREGSPRESE